MKGSTEGRLRAGRFMPYGGSPPTDSAAGPAAAGASPYDRLKESILTGELSPGAPLVETTLAHSIGVSRTPIREALKKLEQDGLVERVDRGLRVRRRSPDEILEIYEVRIVLEGAAARSAAERHREIERVRLTGLLQQLEDMQQAEPEIIALKNRQFHEAIWQASHNQTLVDLLTRLSAHLGRYPLTTYYHRERGRSSLAEHKAIVEAIFDRDAERAGGMAAHHMTVARDLRLAMWQEDPDSMVL